MSSTSTANNQANSKAKHYNSQLTAALLRGAWADPNPGTEPNETNLSWGELIRKWGKHTGGNTTLIHHLRDISLLYLSSRSQTSIASSGYIPVARSAVPEALTGSESSGEGAGSASGSSFIHVPHPSQPRRSEQQGTLQASTSIASLRERAAYLSAGDLDGDESTEAVEWSEGTTWIAEVSGDHIDEVKEGIKMIEKLISSGTLKPSELISARSTLTYHFYGIGDHEAVVRLVFESAGSDPHNGVIEGDSAVLERIRSKCLQAMSMEIVDPTTALSTYLAIIPLLGDLGDFPTPTPSYLATNPARIPFESHREVHRWVSTALTRAAIISSRQPNQLTETLRILRTYHALAASWPAVFKRLQRQRMILLYLRALGAAYPGPGISAAKPYLINSGSTALSARAVWVKEAKEAMGLGRSLLSATTSFPRAGSTNLAVTQFIDLSVSLADRHTPLTRSVIDHLWWAMNLTFQSQHLLRHLTRLLIIAGDFTDAKRTFELYVQLVLKSRQTSQPESTLQLKNLPTDDIVAESTQKAKDVEAADNDAITTGEHDNVDGTAAEHEGDSDADFIEALLVGAKLLTRELGEPEDALRYTTLAGDVVKHAATSSHPIQTELKARVEECKGIVRMTMAATAGDPITRPTYQAQAITHLSAATTLASTSSTAWYHLAFAQAEARSIDAGVEAVRTALELKQSDVQYWHLLALLLTAQRDWTGAAKACDAGVSVWEAEEDADEREEEELTGQEAPNVESKDFGRPAQALANPPPMVSKPLLKPDGSLIPLEQAKPPRLSRSKRLEQVIRLRMTLNVIAEKTHGPETAMMRQQELFAFFSARSGKQRGQFGYTRGMIATSSSMSVAGLGGSYISIPDMAARPDSAGAVNVIPPTPNPDMEILRDEKVPTVPQPLSAPIIVQSAASSPGASTPTSDTDGASQIDNGKSEKPHRRSLTMNRKSIAKHLHVPSVGSIGKGHSSGRPSSVRRLTNPSTPELPLRNNRIASTSSAALSLAPTAVHSHYHGSTPNKIPPPPPLIAADHGRTSAESRILSNLWLQSAATFRRWGKPEQCLVAIEEAETLDPENASVWIQLGLYHMSTTPTPNYEAATPALTKAILLRPEHPAGVISLSKLYFLTGQIDLAHSLLNQVTQDHGWDSPEAWFYLAKVMERQGGRDIRVEECLRFALNMEESRPARRWRDGLDRWLS